MINAVFRNVIHDLVHLNEQLCANGQLIDDFGLHAHIMALMLTEERACRANTHPVLNANDLHLAIVLLAELFWEDAGASLWLLRYSGG